MNALVSELLRYFEDFNTVKTVNILGSNLVDREKTWEIIENIYYAYYSQLSNYTSYMTLKMQFDAAIDLIGLEWSTKRGKFTKRLLKELTTLQAYAGILGDEITRKAYTPNNREWMLSLTEEIFWHDGNFGKDGSCWWHGYRESREVFIDNGGLGLLWHDSLDAYNGIGRCWILPVDEYFSNKGNKPILALFNQYGQDNSGIPIRIEETARVINSLIPDTDNIPAALYNDDDDEIPYINGNAAIMIKPKDLDLKHYDIHVQMGNCHTVECTECGYDIEEDEIYYNNNNEPYCEECYNENYFNCNDCNTEVYREDAYIDYNGYAICYRCYDRHYFTCDDCSEIYRQEDASEIDGYIYCENCAPNHEPEEEPEE